MTIYLRIADGVAVESWDAPNGATPTDCFAPAVAASFVLASGGAVPGWVYANGVWAAPAVATPTQAELVAYASAKQEAICDGGIAVNVGSASTPVEANVASDVKGRGLVTGCVQLIGVASQAGQPAPTFPWINNDGTQLSLTAPQMMTIALALGNFVQATYGALGTVLAAIAAGSMASTSQIDAATWPATTY